MFSKPLYVLSEAGRFQLSESTSFFFVLRSKENTY